MANPTSYLRPRSASARTAEPTIGPTDAPTVTPPTPETTPEPVVAPVVVNIEMPTQPAPVVTDVTEPLEDAYSTALNALIAVVLAILGSGVAIAGMAIWKFAPVVLAVLEFLAKLTPRTDDDAAVARLRQALTDLGVVTQADLNSTGGVLIEAISRARTPITPFDPKAK